MNQRVQGRLVPPARPGRHMGRQLLAEPVHLVPGHAPVGVALEGRCVLLGQPVPLGTVVLALGTVAAGKWNHF